MKELRMATLKRMHDKWMAHIYIWSQVGPERQSS